MKHLVLNYTESLHNIFLDSDIRLQHKSESMIFR